MPKAQTIDRVEFHEFAYEMQDLGYDENRHLVYSPGSTQRALKYAVVMIDNEGRTGEYVPLWSGPTTAVRQTLALAPTFVGAGVHEREYLYSLAKKIHRATDKIGYGPLDIALWDLTGKTLEMPVWKLLGGYRERLPAYASSMHGDPHGGLSSISDYADYAKYCQSLGFTAFKIAARVPYRQEAEYVLGLRDAVGGGMELMTDPGCELMTFAEALYVGRACDEANYYWYEDPMRDGGVSVQLHRRLRQKIKTPLLMGEMVRELEPKADFVIAEATDFIRVDPELDMGITGAIKVARMAESLGIDVEFHGAGPVNRHCMAATRNSNYYEVSTLHPILGNGLMPPVHLDGYSDEVTAVSPDGTYPVPTGPGVGVSYDWDFINSHRTNHIVFDGR